LPNVKRSSPAHFTPREAEPINVSDFHVIGKSALINLSWERRELEPAGCATIGGAYGKSDTATGDLSDEGTREFMRKQLAAVADFARG
jgi:hypothetical protein